MIEEPFVTRVQDLITLLSRIPENRFDMETYCSVDGVHRNDIIPVNICGTTACIAGWATSIMPETALIRDEQQHIDYEQTVCKWLSLSEKQADILFHHYAARKSDALHVLRTYLNEGHIVWPQKPGPP